MVIGVDTRRPFLKQSTLVHRFVHSFVAVFIFPCLAMAAEGTRPAKLALTWTPAPGCIDAPALVALIEHTLERSVFVAAPSADAALVGRIEASGRIFRVHLDVRRTAEATVTLASRDVEIEADDCRALDGSIAVVAALLADGTPALPEAQPPPATRLRVTIPHVPHRVGAAITAGGGVTFGLLPRPASFASATTWIAPAGPLRIGFEGRVWLPQTELVGDTGAGVSAFTLGGSACWRPVRGRFVISTCVRFDAGAMIDAPIGLTSSGSSERGLLIAGADLRAGMTIAGPLYTEIFADLGVPLARPLFYYTDRSGATVDLNQVFPITASLGLVIGVRFGE